MDIAGNAGRPRLTRGIGLVAASIVFMGTAGWAAPSAAAGQVRVSSRPPAVPWGSRPGRSFAPGLSDVGWGPRLGGAVAPGSFRPRSESAPGVPVTTGPWSIQPTPNTTAPDGRLASVSCPSATDCVAVGDAIDGVGVDASLAESWDGSAWTNQDAAAPPDAVSSALLGVSCPTADACTAVGVYLNGSGVIVPLAETWDGSGWSLVSVPTPSGAIGAELAAVSCSSSTACSAVGGYGDPSGITLTLAESWDGSNWSVVTTPNPAGAQGSFLASVSCPSSGACAAVGSFQDGTTGTGLTLAESWDGSNWSISTTPDPSGSQGSQLSGVSCPTAGACTAVGMSIDGTGAALPLAERWDGTKWSLQATATPSGATGSGLFAVSCPDATTCTAAGEYAAVSGPVLSLAEAWDGSSWSVQATPNPAGGFGNGLAGLSCPSSAACMAVGSHTNKAGTSRTLSETWAGTDWTIVRTPVVEGATSSFLSSVSCPSAGTCFAVGSGTTSRGVGLALAERWDGSAWTIQPTAEPAGVKYGFLSSVSCPSGRFCMAVGWYSTGTRTDYGFAERWDGESWSVVDVPNPPDSGGTDLRAVSCTTRMACTAVGQFNEGAGSRTVAEYWDGTRWRVHRTPNPARTQFNDLDGISCVSAKRCTAVGSTVKNISAFGLTLAEVRHGTTWTIEKTPNPKDATGSFLSAVSCVSTSECIAVGSSVDRSLVEAWDGSRWRLRRSPNPSGFAAIFLNGVSCTSSSSCTAVGNKRDDFGPESGWAARWNGSVWTVEDTPNPASAQKTYLAGVSCTSDGVCDAVGGTLTWALVTVTLAESKGT